MGLSSQLVGTSHECDHPDNIAHLPKLTSSSIHSQGKSREIHDSVENLIQNTLSVYDLNLDLLRTLKPDLIITQDICDVCAVPLPQVEEACKKVLGPGIQIITLQPKRLQDIWDDMQKVAEMTDRQEAFHNFKSDVDRRIQAIRDRIASSEAPKKRILTIEWMDPVMVGGMWVPDMIEMVAGEYLLASPGQHAMTADQEQLRSIDPDVVVVKPCGFKLDQTVRDFGTLKEAIPWEQWEIFRTDNIFLVDGNAYFNRPGPRIIDSLEMLAFCAHPERFRDFGELYNQKIIRLDPGLKLRKPA
ncbi:MAG: cobalamin-binding protein [Nitrospinaceae bacterium]|nr:MAG: cobalamin-binding protein [Nitrospinaceae bacterium]